MEYPIEHISFHMPNATLKICVRRYSGMIARKIVIDKQKCNGCGLCVNACHEGAIAMIDGKASLVNGNLCDGIGDCLPACPMDAITFTEDNVKHSDGLMATPEYQWPIQTALVSPMSGSFRDALVVAADCSAFVTDDFKRKFVRGRGLIIGCPKLDPADRFDKIFQILDSTNINDVEVIRMEVPCCRPLVSMVLKAAEKCHRKIAVKETIISLDGKLIQPATAVSGSQPSLSQPICPH